MPPADLSSCVCVCVCTCEDFVLVYEEELDTEEKTTESEREDLDRDKKWRETFMRNLRKTGVHCEEVAPQTRCFSDIDQLS